MNFAVLKAGCRNKIREHAEHRACSGSYGPLQNVEIDARRLRLKAAGI